MQLRDELQQTQQALDAAEAEVARLRDRRRQLVVEACEGDERSEAQVAGWIGRPRQSVHAIRERAKG